MAEKMPEDLQAQIAVAYEELGKKLAKRIRSLSCT